MSDPKKSSPALIVAAWLVVLVPAAWGLSYTAKNAAKIFTRPEAPPPAMPAAPADGGTDGGAP